ncbi:MAG TPA: aminotransferase class V-fold PLP-dependent enzyme [Puia sp.]|nr:aminotransferase class V-fold PLP-dependent enzyme [Puia sp.]
MESATLKSQFLLSPDIIYLNFGSFGACSRPVFDDYQRWQRELEFEPVQFITVNGPRYLQQSREALAGFVHCPADDMVYVMNPSYGVNIVAKSLPLNPGDEILSTDIEYGACDRTWNYYCKKKGAKYVRQHISLPIVSKEKLVEDFFSGLSSRTKAVFLSHITSSTALILPVKEICAIAKQKGLLTIVDGAHAPGHIPLDISDLHADIYVGACHKWMMTPKGCSFLYATKNCQDWLDPLLISWGYDSAHPSHSRFLDYHQGQGTRDFSAFLTVPRAIQFMKDNHWDVISAGCREIVQKNAGRFCELLGSSPLCPVGDEFLGQMFSIPVRSSQPDALKQYLFDAYKIEVPVMTQEGDVYIRYSINAFNSQGDLDALYVALKDILANTDLLQAKTNAGSALAY